MSINLDIQFFSHLNDINLFVTQGSLLQLYDKCLVNGHSLPSVVSLELLDGNIKVTFSSDHKTLLFQLIELKNFSPSAINNKYRVIGVISPTVLLLKTSVAITDIPMTMGSASLPPLGYEIIFSETLKRVYRAKNPQLNHPFIRMDETIVDGSNSYSATYSKSLMVGLIENMVNINDYENPAKLQLPMNTANLKENWQISGTGTAVVRGRCKHYWAMGGSAFAAAVETNTASVSTTTPLPFTLCGDKDVVYICNPVTVGDATQLANKSLHGFGLFDSATDDSIIPSWFLMLPDRKSVAAGTTKTLYDVGGMPLAHSLNGSKFLVTKYTPLSKISDSAVATPILPDYATGNSNIFSNTACGALQVPFYDSNNNLRGNLKHVHYSGNSRGTINTTPILSGNSMYISDNVYGANGVGVYGTCSIYFYLGESE